MAKMLLGSVNWYKDIKDFTVHSVMQIAGDATGLTLSDSSAITFATAVSAINVLRDALGGTRSSSVENSLTRNPTAVTGVTIASPGPDLFAADANSVAYTRIPGQAST